MEDTSTFGRGFHAESRPPNQQLTQLIRDRESRIPVPLKHRYRNLLEDPDIVLTSPSNSSDHISMVMKIWAGTFPDDIHMRMAAMMEVWQSIMDATSFAWHCTSIFRLASTNHGEWLAIDIAPLVKPGTPYGTAINSDPVLYRRRKLIAALRRYFSSPSAPKSADWGYTVGVFVENDHIHIQLVQPYVDEKGRLWNVIVVPYPKVTRHYPDSERRYSAKDGKFIEPYQLAEPLRRG